MFEIGRRLVQDDAEEQSTETKQAFDKLPISTVITAIVKLLEGGRYKFEHVFHPNGKFHWFTGEPGVRRGAIEKLESAGMEALFCGDEVKEASEENAVEGEEASEQYSSEDDDANE